MAKPLHTPDIWASDDDYNFGPKSGLPTKTPVLQIVLAAAQGHIPGNLNPTTANEFNRWCFEVSEICKWVFEGTFLADLTAHIVETDDTGKARIATAIIGGALTSGPSLVVNESNTGTGPSLRVNAVDDIAAEISTLISDESIFIEQIIATTDSDFSDAVGKSYVWKFASFPKTAANDGPGGMEITTKGSGSDTAGKIWGSLRAFNQDGIAGIFESSTTGPQGTVEIHNQTVQGVSLFIGNRTSGAGMIGSSIRGGAGNPTNDIAGGTGGLFFGGAGLDGLNDVDGGVGLFAIGGSAVSGTPGVGAEIRSGGVGASSLVLRHTAELSQTSPLIFGDTGENIGGGVTMVCEGSGHGAELATQAGDGLRLLKSETAAFLMGTHIYLQPIINKIVNVTLSDGDLWFTRTDVGGNDYFDLRIKANPIRYIPMFANPVVYGYAEKSSQTAAITLGVPVNALTVSLSPELAPIIPNAPVIITVHCFVLATTFTPPIVGIGKLTFFDDTASVIIPAGERQIDGHTSAVRSYLSYSFEYILPAGGARSITMRIQKDDSDPTNVSVGGMSIKIESKWDQ